MFGHLFCKYVLEIRDNFDDLDYAFEYDNAFAGTPLTSFKSLSENKLNTIVVKAASKSCEIDPIPNNLLKSYMDVRLLSFFE